MEQTHTPASTSEHSMDLPKKKRPVGKIILIILGIIVLIAASIGLGYWYRDRQAKEQAEELNQQVSELQAQKKAAEENAAKIQAELDELKATKASTVTVNATTIKNVEAALTSGNYAALEQYMTNPVKVVIAASGGVSDKTPAEAVASMSYVDAGTDPWTTSIVAATLTAWRSGPYKQYFATTSVVAKSANNYVVSVGFNSAGKIDTLFMTNNAALLAN